MGDTHYTLGKFVLKIKGIECKLETKNNNNNIHRIYMYPSHFAKFQVAKRELGFWCGIFN